MYLRDFNRNTTFRKKRKYKIQKTTRRGTVITEELSSPPESLGLTVATTARTDDLGGRPRTTSAEADRQSVRSRLKCLYSYIMYRVLILSLYKVT